MDLRVNTVVDVLVGPFVDEDNGKDAEGGLTITQAEVRLSKNGGNMAQKTEATSPIVHDELGYYLCKLDATDTNAEGILVLAIHESGALPVRHEYNVLSEAAWDSLYAAKDAGYMDVNVKSSDDIDLTATQKSSVTTAVPTVAEIQAEMEENGASILDAIRDLVVAAGDGDLAAIKAKTDNLPADPADDSDIDTQLAAIKAETALIVADTGADGVVIAVGAIDTTQFAAGGIDAAALAADAANEIRDAVWAKVLESNGSLTAQQIMQVLLAVIAGVTTTDGALFKTPDGAVTRVTITYDAVDNERDTVVFNL